MEIPVVAAVSGAQLGTVRGISRQEFCRLGLADFQPCNNRVKLVGSHAGLNLLNDGHSRRFLQIGTGILAISGLKVVLVLFKDKYKQQKIGSIPLKFIVPLPVRH